MNPMVILRGTLSSLFLILNTILWCGLLYPVALAKFLIRSVRFQEQCKSMMVLIAEMWITCNNIYFKLALPTSLQLQIPRTLNLDRSYLVISNHRSWVDILILQMALNGKAPFLRFFIKDTLKWMPFLGVAWKSLDYPFMKRATVKSSNKSGKQDSSINRDLETANEACKQMLGRAVSVLIFLEGTRFTKEKQSHPKNTYKNLLRPKIGGATAVLDVLGDQIHSVIDVTIAYPEGHLEFLDFICGKTPEVKMQARELDLPEIFLKGRLQTDAEIRRQFDSWIEQIWKSKDQLLDS